MLDELNNIEGLLSDIKRLKKRSELLIEIMRHYNADKMMFDVPEKWKPHRIRPDKFPAESPRHLLHKKIKEALSYEELGLIGIYNIY